MRGVTCALPVNTVAHAALGGSSGGVSSFGYNGTIVHAILRRTDDKSGAAELLPRSATTAALVFKRRSFAWDVPVFDTDGDEGFSTSQAPQPTPAADSRLTVSLTSEMPLMEAGFTSLVAARLAADLQNKLGTSISPVVLFQYPTPSQLEAHLREVASELPDELNGVNSFITFLETFRAEAHKRFDITAEDLLDDGITVEMRMDADVENMDLGPMAPLSTLTREPQVILLTGVTGWLGSFVLSELLMQTSATIYCLVRAENALAGKRRIEAGMAQLGTTTCRCIVVLYSLAVWSVSAGLFE